MLVSQSLLVEITSTKNADHRETWVAPEYFQYSSIGCDDYPGRMVFNGHDLNPNDQAASSGKFHEWAMRAALIRIGRSGEHTDQGRKRGDM